MATGRPMNEYESALYMAVRTLGLAIIEMGGNKMAMQAGLEDAQEFMETDGRTDGAATLKLLRDTLFEPGVAYIPGIPPQKSN